MRNDSIEDANPLSRFPHCISLHCGVLPCAIIIYQLEQTYEEEEEEVKRKVKFLDLDEMPTSSNETK